MEEPSPPPPRRGDRAGPGGAKGSRCWRLGPRREGGSALRWWLSPDHARHDLHFMDGGVVAGRPTDLPHRRRSQDWAQVG